MTLITDLYHVRCGETIAFLSSLICDQCNKNQDVCILDLCTCICTCTYIAHVDVSFFSCLFPFSDVLIFVLFFVQATSFNERNAFLLPFKCCSIYYMVILCYCLENKFWFIDWSALNGCWFWTFLSSCKFIRGLHGIELLMSVWSFNFYCILVYLYCLYIFAMLWYVSGLWPFSTNKHIQTYRSWSADSQQTRFRFAWNLLIRRFMYLTYR